MTLKRPDQFRSVDQGIYGHLTLHNLAVLAEERGDRGEARRLWRMVLDACPGDSEAMSRGEASKGLRGVRPRCPFRKSLASFLGLSLIRPWRI